MHEHTWQYHGQGPTLTVEPHWQQTARFICHCGLTKVSVIIWNNEPGEELSTPNTQDGDK